MNLQQSTSLLQERLNRCSKRIEDIHIDSQLGQIPNKKRTVVSRQDKAGLQIDIDRRDLSSTRKETLDQANRDLDEARMALIQSQKMESLGALASGMAHEINTPLQYIGGNLEFMKQAFDELTAAMAICMNLIDDLDVEIPSIQQRKNRLDFAMSRLPNAISKSLEGVDAVGKIVRAMRGFSHITDEWLETDVNDCIDSVLAMSQSEWKYCANVKFEPQAKLPKISAHPGQLNQAFLNLVVNAAHAVEEKCSRHESLDESVVDRPTGNGYEKNAKGEIRIRTYQKDQNVCVEISDTGRGIPNEIENRIFDQFFTTKEVGKGTGQGLAICWSIFVDEHGGQIEVQSKENEGSTFTVYLPLAQEAA